MKVRNNIIPNNHFHKKWDELVKTWFDQPAAKQRRRIARTKKAIKVAPRPVAGLLRPAVHAPTQKYNSKLRAGKGFTLEELKEAGIRKKEAQSIGIAVDYRRQNHSQESLKLNVQRLKAYKSKLIVFPKNAKKPKKGDSTKEETSKAVQLKAKEVLPIVQIPAYTKPRKVTEEEKKKSVYAILRKARSDVKLVGKRAKRAAEKEATDAAAAKKAAKSDTKAAADE